MSLTVVDASVLAAFYTADDARSRQARTRLAAGHALFAPAHIDAEVISALRGLVNGSHFPSDAVPAALRHLADFPIRRMPISPLLERMWQLRHNVTPYDAAYVALAEHLNATLLTSDVKLANASGTRCAFDLID